MSTTYYVDGYNVLHKSAALGALARHDLESAREALIDRIATYSIATGTRVILVFDGLGKQKTETVEHHRGALRLDVRYAPSHLSADAVIEREVYREPAKMQVVVVSNDQGIRDLIRGMGALVMDSAHFLTTLTESDRDLKTTLQRTRRQSPEFLEDQLDENTIARLQALKKKL